MANHVAALDLGGTKIAGAIVDEAGTIIREKTIDTEAVQGPNHVISRMINLVQDLRNGLVTDPGNDATNSRGDLPIKGLGVASPGPLSTKEGLVLQPPNLPGWTSIPLVSQLATALNLPVWLENDANAAALAEARYGAGRGAANIVYVTISTGIGAGIVINGQLYTGVSDGAGEIGHTTVDALGEPCPACGGRGCLENLASGTALTRRARQETNYSTAKELMNAARQGDKQAIKIVDETIAYLGAGLANVIQLINPERLILGGGVILNNQDLLMEPLKEQIKQRSFKPAGDACTALPASLGAQAGVLGAAALAWSKL